MLLEIPIHPDDAGQRAERFLRRYLPGLSTGRLQSLFRRKEIKIARRPIGQGHLLAADSVLQVYGLRPEECARPASTAGTKALPDAHRETRLSILFEDADLLVLDKPAGVAAHPGTGIPPGASMIERAQAYLGSGENRGWSDALFSPALAHRLDKETSGVLLIAKTGARLRSLVELFRAGGIRKRYCALVMGHPDPESGLIDLPLEREDNAAGGAKTRVVATGGKAARTRYRTVKKTGSHALLQVIIETGRMHQIRSHLAHLGHPLVGDTRYGRPSEARETLRALGLKRLFLHAEEIAWTEDGATETYRAPLPVDLKRVLDALDSRKDPAA